VSRYAPLGASIRHVFQVTALVVAAGSTTSIASAQQWYVDTQAGRIRSALDPSATGAENVVVTPSVLTGVRYEHPFGGVRISAGLPTSGEKPLWGSVGAWKSLIFRRDRVFIGLDLGVMGFSCAIAATGRVWFRANPV